MTSTARTGRCGPAHHAPTKCDPYPVGHMGTATSGPRPAPVTPAGEDRLFVETMARAHAANVACEDQPENSLRLGSIVSPASDIGSAQAPIAPPAATGPGGNQAN